MTKKQETEQPGVGHNSGIAAKRLNAFIERIERLEEEKKGLADDIKDVYAEAKGVGFDTKIIRKVVNRRKIEKEKLREEDELLDLYEFSISSLNEMMEYENE
jgi:uncharacterized protein (UPF0335 family)